MTSNFDKTSKNKGIYEDFYFISSTTTTRQPHDVHCWAYASPNDRHDDRSRASRIQDTQDYFISYSFLLKHR